jgi:hypothetical protein
MTIELKTCRLGQTERRNIKGHDVKFEGYNQKNYQASP